jgi:hypothetical protein
MGWMGRTTGGSGTGGSGTGGSSTTRRRLASGLALAVTVALGTLVGPAGIAAAAGTGSVSGQISDAGVPIAGVTVGIDLSVFPVAIATGTTDATGSFHINVPAGLYKVKFALPGGLTQFYPHVTDFNAATQLTVVEGQDTAVTETVVVPHGSLAGQITTSTGAVASGAFVGLAQPGGPPVANVTADQNGRYVFPYVAAGSYDVTAGATASGAPHQWVHGHKSQAQADPIAVVVGQVSTVDEQLLPLGRVRGTFTDGNGPVSDVLIEAISQTSAADSVFTSTGADGTYSLFAYPGTYIVKYQVPASLDQWANEKEAQWRADVVTVVANTDLVLDQTALPTGRVSGRLTDPDGNPVSGAGVAIENPSLDREFLATTDADGSWFATVRPGTYRVSFETETQQQWAHGQTSPGTAAPVTVAAGGNTVVDEALLVQGSLTVTAVDARTGAALTSFCVETSGTADLFACTDNGTADFPQIGAGTYAVTVSDGDHLDSVTDGVQVTSGHASTVAARLQRGATITIDVKDAATGAPVGSSVCVDGKLADTMEELGVGDCVDSSGVITLTRVKPGNYVFFASVFDGVHGAQWVGPHGGVGAQADARVVTVHYGDSAQVHVRLDGAGTIAGTVTDQRTGAPVADVEVGTFGAGAVTGADGHYQLDGLGPYQWVLYFDHTDYAGVWSGGGNNRLTATPIRVRLGQTTPYSTSLTTGTTLTVKVADLAGRPPDSADVEVVDAHTFDVLAHATAASGGVYTTHVLGPQQVKVLVSGGEFDGTCCTASVWYPNASDFAHGQTLLLPSSGARAVSVVIGFG